MHGCQAYPQRADPPHGPFHRRGDVVQLQIQKDGRAVFGADPGDQIRTGADKEFQPDLEHPHMPRKQADQFLGFAARCDVQRKNEVV